MFNTRPGTRQEVESEETTPTLREQKILSQGKTRWTPTTIVTKTHWHQLSCKLCCAEETEDKLCSAEDEGRNMETKANELGVRPTISNNTGWDLLPALGPGTAQNE